VARLPGAVRLARRRQRGRRQGRMSCTVARYCRSARAAPNVAGQDTARLPHHCTFALAAGLLFPRPARQAAAGALQRLAGAATGRDDGPLDANHGN